MRKITSALLAALAIQCSAFAETDDDNSMRQDFEKQQTYNAKALELYIRDGKELAEYDIFTSPSLGTRDAGPYLNGKFPCFGNKNPAKYLLALPTALRDELQRQKDWIHWEPQWRKWKLDFSWMRKLHTFDFWNTEANNPCIRESRFSALTPKSQFTPSDLHYWVRLRLLKGRDDHQVLAALKDVRQIARLLFTQEDPMWALSGIGILNLEEKFAATYLPEWKPIPEPIRKHAKRFLYVPAGLANPYLPLKPWDEAIHLKAGLCARVSEILLGSLMIRAYLPELASDYLSAVKKLEKDTGGLCRPSEVRRAWNDKEYSYFADEDDFRTKSHLPFQATLVEELQKPQDRQTEKMNAAMAAADFENHSKKAVEETKAMRANRKAREGFGRLMLSLQNRFGVYLYKDEIEGK